MIKGIIFDADNTLYSIDAEKAYDKLYTYLASALDETGDSIKRKHKGLVKLVKNEKDPAVRTYSHTIRALLSEYDRCTEDLIRNALEIFWNEIIKGLEETPTSVMTVIGLKDSYTLAIASDEFINILEKKLRRIFGPWRDSFKLLVTPEDTGTMKPSKKYYEIALAKLGLEPGEVLVVGDSYIRDLEPASSLGMRTVLLSEKKEGRPDFHIRKMIELKKIIRKCES